MNKEQLIVDKTKLKEERRRCKRIEKNTKSQLWKEGARWNLEFIDQLLEGEYSKTEVVI